MTTDATKTQDEDAIQQIRNDMNDLYEQSTGVYKRTVEEVRRTVAPFRQAATEVQRLAQQVDEIGKAQTATKESVTQLGAKVDEFCSEANESITELNTRLPELEPLPGHVAEIRAAQKESLENQRQAALEMEVKLTALREKTERDLKAMDEKLKVPDPNLAGLGDRLAKIEKYNEEWKEVFKEFLKAKDKQLGEYEERFKRLEETSKQTATAASIAALHKRFVRYLLATGVATLILSVTLFVVAMLWQSSQPSSKGAPPIQQTYTKAIDFSGGSKKTP